MLHKMASFFVFEPGMFQHLGALSVLPFTQDLRMLCVVREDMGLRCCTASASTSCFNLFLGACQNGQEIAIQVVGEPRGEGVGFTRVSKGGGPSPMGDPLILMVGSAPKPF